MLIILIRSASSLRRYVICKICCKRNGSFGSPSSVPPSKKKRVQAGIMQFFGSVNSNVTSEHIP